MSGTGVSERIFDTGERECMCMSFALQIGKRERAMKLRH